MCVKVIIIIGTIYIWILTILLALARGSLLPLEPLLAPSPPKSLQNEVILVTGGSSGIGRSILEIISLPESDVTLISWDVDSAKNEATIERLKTLGEKAAVAMTVDVKNKSQVSAAAEKIRREFGNVTMLFNNVGITGPFGRCWKTDLNDQELTIQVNFMSHLYTLREFLPWMVENNRGDVIATCSLVGRHSIQINENFSLCCHSCVNIAGTVDPEQCCNLIMQSRSASERPDVRRKYF